MGLFRNFTLGVSRQIPLGARIACVLSFRKEPGGRDEEIQALPQLRPNTLHSEAGASERPGDSPAGTAGSRHCTQPINRHVLEGSQPECSPALDTGKIETPAL